MSSNSWIGWIFISIVVATSIAADPKKGSLLTLEGVELPADLLVLSEVQLLDPTGQEVTISADTKIEVLTRSGVGTLTLRVGGKNFVGNESRLKGKVRIKTSLLPETTKKEIRHKDDEDQAAQEQQELNQLERAEILEREKLLKSIDANFYKVEKNTLEGLLIRVAYQRRIYGPWETVAVPSWLPHTKETKEFTVGKVFQAKLLKKGVFRLNEEEVIPLFELLQLLPMPKD